MHSIYGQADLSRRELGRDTLGCPSITGRRSWQFGTLGFERTEEDIR
jgi:hypothetical protein